MQGLSVSYPRETGMDNSELRYRREILKMVFKSKNQLAPEYLNSMFIKLSEFRNRQLRNSDTDLYVPVLKTAYGQNSLSYRGAKLWNSQRTEVKKAKSFIQFVKSLKNHRFCSFTRCLCLYYSKFFLKYCKLVLNLYSFL